MIPELLTLLNNPDLYVGRICCTTGDLIIVRRDTLPATTRIIERARR